MATASISPSKRSGGGVSGVASVTALQMRAAGPAPPLDYSFMGLATLSDMLLHDPVSGQKKPDATASNGPDDDAATSSAVQKPTHAAPVSLRVNNNKLTHLDDMDEALAAVFPDASKLQWIDLSGNALTSVPATAFAKYPEIFSLHLHGNKLAKYADIDHLAAWLPRVHALTLHGNPLEEKKHYKNYVISSFPNLKQLDFSCVTKGDREKAETWAKIYKKALQAARANKGRGGGSGDAEYD